MSEIKYAKVSNSEPVIDFLVGRLEANLSSGKRVFWLLPGGSAIKLAVEVARRLQAPLAKLTVSLTDERYGPVDYPDSNWRQLIDAGLSLPGANLQPVLTGKPLEQTVDDYTNMLIKYLSKCDYSLALAGMGTDGHIFGIKPASPAVSADKPVVGYTWDDYVRITPTAKILKMLDEIVILAIGQQKHKQFDRLEADLAIDEQPAQLLKQLSKVTIFNDYKGEVL